MTLAGAALVAIHTMNLAIYHAPDCTMRRVVIPTYDAEIPLMAVGPDEAAIAIESTLDRDPTFAEAQVISIRYERIVSQVCR